MLEHGLAPSELAVLTDSVRAWVRTASASTRFWLPFVVYATEVGYRYEGEDYWPTLEAHTPGWERHTDRHYVSRRFKDFARTYGGAEPKGRWASHFTIICWPITHAVLPTDLQRQLARLLYEYRGALTAELLADPDALGAALAARAGYASKRFQQFAENTELLGQVAAALLSGDEDAALLSKGTLHRIIDDLTAEREARRWLRDARQSADRVRIAGAAPQRDGTPTSRAAAAQITRATGPVPVTIHSTNAGWQLRIRVPDFTPLFVRHPDLAANLASVRCRVAGFSGPPRPRGWLRYAGQQLALDSWPGIDAPMFVLERSDDRMTALVGEEARTPPSTTWLFRVGADGSGTLVRSSAVRPGSTYVVVGPDVSAAPSPWILPDEVEIQGANALRFTVPSLLDAATRAALHAIGCAAVTTVSIDPVGVVPAAWDGESYGEWIVGDQPLLMVRSSHELTACTIALDRGDVIAVPWKDLDDGCAIVQFGNLRAGTHHVRFSFLATDDTAVPDGHLDIRIREPEPTRSGGTYRDSLQAILSPANASLEELWEDRASLEVLGMHGAAATITVRLHDVDGETVSHQFGPVTLPIDTDDWRATFGTHVRARTSIQAAYDDAVRAEVEVSDSELGSVAVTVERATTPLRWGYRRIDGGPALRLHESADLGITPTITHYTFAQPDVAHAVTTHSDVIRDAGGGLFVATLDTYVARAILPPDVHDLHDLRRLGVAPELREQAKSVQGVTNLLRIAEHWCMATIPGDPFAESARSRVAAAVASELSALIGGGLWRALERRQSTSLTELEAGLARPGQWQRFRQQVRELGDVAGAMTTEQIIERFARTLGPTPPGHLAKPGLIVSSTARARYEGTPTARFTVSNSFLAEFLLRLSSAPGRVRDWAGENAGLLGEIIETPVVLRAARLLVLARDRELRAWTWD